MARSNFPSDLESSSVEETALLVGVRRPNDPSWKADAMMQELTCLVSSAGARIREKMFFTRREPNPGLFIGSGQAEQVRTRTESLRVDTVVFDGDLSPAQGRNLERILHTRVVDRTQVILDIFAQRAHTAEGRLQVELAQLQYLLPRLRRMWTHLERQRGGIGLKGPGEQQIEMDRRRIEVRIHRIRRELEAVRQRRHELRRGRARHGWARLCLVGYTNAGKSTLLNALSRHTAVRTDDKLFATLDPTTRRILLPSRETALLTDTVGFIQKLPHRLVEAFRATLEEVTEADLLIHVLDASHPEVEAQAEAVETVLAELGADEKPRVVAWNKCDVNGTLGRIRALAVRFPPGVPISARTGMGLDRLRMELADSLRDRAVVVHLVVPAGAGRILALIHKAGYVHSQKYEGNTVQIYARIPRRLREPLSPFIQQGAEPQGGEQK